MQKDIEWAARINDDDHEKSGFIYSNNQLINYLNERLYRKYEPTKSPSAHFESRMHDWIENADNLDDKVHLHSLIPKIFFIGEEEFNSLYRVAMQEIIIPWLVDECSLKFTNKDFKQQLENEVTSTWLCPISDSLRINAFYHVNKISGREYRPDWRSLAQFSDKDKLKEFLVKNKIKRIVLLEDFVGSGGQACRILNFILSLNIKINTLIIPLVICPKGSKKITETISKIPNIEYNPVLVIPDSEIFTPDVIEGEKDLSEVIRKLNTKYHTKMQVDFSVKEGEQEKIGAYGYRNTGALIVMYSNCPNNTLSLIHAGYPSDWTPLFPRSKRV